MSPDTDPRSDATAGTPPLAAGPAARYAVYLAPTHGWLRAGERWLGRSADTGQAIARGLGDDVAIDDWTEAPRHYGLHATLKPPFRLAEGMTAEGLDAAVRDLAKSFASFDLPLRLMRLRGFLAWGTMPDGDLSAVDGKSAAAGSSAQRLPAASAGRVAAAADSAPNSASNAEPNTLLQHLADRCVVALDDFRAPPTAAELERRRATTLTPAQERQLSRWGYPYVFDTFTFHITLSGKLDDASLDAAQAALARLEPPGDGQAMPVRAISIYVQTTTGAPFIVARHYHFDGSVENGAGAAWLQSRS